MVNGGLGQVLIERFPGRPASELAQCPIPLFINQFLLTTHYSLLTTRPLTLVVHILW